MNAYAEYIPSQLKTFTGLSVFVKIYLMENAISEPIVRMIEL